MSQMNSNDPRRPDRVQRYKPLPAGCIGSPSEDPTPDYMNLLSMLFSMCGLMMKLKWSAWIALFCSAISFANLRMHDDFKQIFSCFMLSFLAVVMTYLQNPLPMTLPFTN
ncbi:PAT complex subunit Asterix [Dermatophagoides farinae]|uniref:Asterix-like protein n=1 Tax=Dermatophagoides farinae TaxID=6954 RepID=A0A922KUS7_DERFA|nr:PAT complex subunit Asterix-like [Dermatophagoides farinae]KAH7644199.1 asterix-like protein [Dermatophagoides farinae]KAH9493931.1 Protein Asterix [Dermatophagoides farinae]